MNQIYHGIQHIYTQIGRDKMKKLITFLIGLLMVISALAQPLPPAPVKITVSVNDVNIDFKDTKVTNLATGEVLTVEDVSGLYIRDGIGLFDLSKFKLGYETIGRRYGGDKIEIIACNIHPDCITTFTIDSTLPRTVSINIHDLTISDYQYYYVCSDNSLVKNKVDCPIIEPEIKTITETEIIEKVIQKEIPEETDFLLETFLAIIGFILGLLAYKYAWLKGFAGMWKAKVEKATTKEQKKKQIESGIKAIKTVLKKDKEGCYKK